MHILKRTYQWLFRILIGLFLGVLILGVVALIILEVPIVQQFTAKKAIQYINQSLQIPIQLEKIEINLPDEVTLTNVYLPDQNQDTLLYVSSLEADIALFELFDSKVNVEELLLENIVGNVIRGTNESDFNYQFILDKFESDTTKSIQETETTTWEISAESIEFSNFAVLYKDDASTFKQRLCGQYFSAQIPLIDLGRSAIRVGDILLKNAHSYTSLKSDTAHPVEEESSLQNPISLKTGWDVSINSIQLQNNQISYHDQLYPDTVSIFDPNHINLSRFNLIIEDIKLDDNAVSALLKNISFEEKSGLAIEQLQVDIKLGAANGGSIKNFSLKTPSSHLQFDVETKYLSIDELLSLAPSTEIDLNLKNFSTDRYKGYKDLTYFLPQSQIATFQNFLNGLTVSGSLQGNPAQSMKLENFEVQVLEQTGLVAKGHFRNLLKTDSLQYQITIDSLFSKYEDIVALFGNVLPEEISLPPEITANASVRGGIHQADVFAYVKTNLGKLETQVLWESKPTQKASSIHGNTQLENIELDKLLQNEQLGKATANANFNLLLPDSAANEITSKLEVTSLEWNKNEIQDINLNLELIGEKLTLNSNSLDSALAFDLLLQSEIGKFQKYELDFQLNEANLVKLGLSDSITHMSTTTHAIVELSKLDDLNIELTIQELGFIRNGESTKLNNLDLTLFQQTDSLFVQSENELLDLELHSNMNLSAIAPEFTNYLSKYTNRLESIPDSTPTSFLNLTLNARKLPVWYELLIPDLDYAEQLSLKLDYNQQEYLFEVKCMTDSIQVNGIAFNQLAVSLLNEQDFLALDFKSHSIKNEYLELYQPLVQTKVRQDTAQVAIMVNDSIGATNFYLNTILSQQDSSFYLHIDEDTLLLDGKKWSISSSNAISLQKNNLTVKDFSLEREGESLQVYTKTDEKDLLKIAFKHFKLDNLLSIIGIRENELSGAINGEITLSDIFNSFQFESNLKLDSLKTYELLLGNLQLKADNSDDDYNLDAHLQGEGNNLQLNGKYLLEQEALDIQAVFSSFDISSLEGLSAGYLKDVSGKLTGELAVKGAPSIPEITGKLQFDSSNFLIPYLNTGFSIDQQNITFEPNNIRFDGFTMLDTEGNPAKVDGNIIKNDFLVYALDLNISAERFKALDTKDGDNELFYGKVMVNSDISVVGDLSSPTVDMSLELLPGSEVTYLVQDDELLIEEQKGIVEFVQIAQQDTIKLEAEADSLGENVFTGLDINMNIKINDATKLAVVIDEAAGDKLEIEGSGDLVYKLQRNGNMTLAGRYIIDEGFYLLTFYGLVKKRFEIAKGSSVLWKGDPYDAALSIQTVYQTRTSPEVLMTNAGNVGNQYQRPEIFQVLMNIRGELEKPQIDFELDIPQAERSDARVYNTVRLLNQNEAELNKQVFALLVFNSFISTNTNDQDIGDEFISSTARTSVSQLLTQQLNNLSEKFIKGVQLDLNLDAYGSGKQKGTDLQVGISKALFNDRVTVEVGGSYQLEGEAQSGTNTLLGNVAIEYRITDDGRYKLRFYQMNDTNMLDGQITSTGLSVIFTRDYNKLKELFNKKTDEE